VCPVGLHLTTTTTPQHQDRLQSDAMALHTASFLRSPDLGRLAACASYWRGLLLGDGARWLWRDALQQEVSSRVWAQVLFVAQCTDLTDFF
jgi:hypothetical protein